MPGAPSVEPTEDTEPGQVILLNGVSSSGKTSIAEALLDVLDRPYFHVSVDAIGAMRSTTRTNSCRRRRSPQCSPGPAPGSTEPWPGWPGPATTSSPTTCSASPGG